MVSRAELLRSIRRASSALVLLFLVLLVLLLTQLFVATVIAVDGASMEPTIARGAVVVVRREKRAFARGAIVGLTLPTGKLVKRIIGLPRETVAIKNGEVMIGGPASPAGGLIAREPYVSGPTEGTLELELKDDEFLVLGDNRDDSVDSRQFGPVRRLEIIGRVRAVLWPEFQVF